MFDSSGRRDWERSSSAPAWTAEKPRSGSGPFESNSLEGEEIKNEEVSKFQSTSFRSRSCSEEVQSRVVFLFSYSQLQRHYVAVRLSRDLYLYI